MNNAIHLVEKGDTERYIYIRAPYALDISVSLPTSVGVNVDIGFRMPSCDCQVKNNEEWLKGIVESFVSKYLQPAEEYNDAPVFTRQYASYLKTFVFHAAKYKESQLDINDYELPSECEDYLIDSYENSRNGQLLSQMETFINKHSQAYFWQSNECLMVIQKNGFSTYPFSKTTDIVIDVDCYVKDAINAMKGYQKQEFLDDIIYRIYNENIDHSSTSTEENIDS